MLQTSQVVVSSLLIISNLFCQFLPLQKLRRTGCDIHQRIDGIITLFKWRSHSCIWCFLVDIWFESALLHIFFFFDNFRALRYKLTIPSLLSAPGEEAFVNGEVVLAHHLRALLDCFYEALRCVGIESAFIDDLFFILSFIEIANFVQNISSTPGWWSNLSGWWCSLLITIFVYIWSKCIEFIFLCPLN